MVFNAPQNFALFKQRRKKLLERITEMHRGASKGVIIVGAAFETERYAFRQENSFYYLTGISEPAVLLCMFFDGTEVLYMPRFTIAREQWVNVVVKGPEDAARFGFDTIKYLGNPVPGYACSGVFTRDLYEGLIADLALYLDRQTKVFGLLDKNNSGYAKNINLFEHLQTWLSVMHTNCIDISPMVADLRCVKDEYEIDLTYKAVQITNMAHRAAAGIIKDGRYEHEIQAALEYVYTHVAATSAAFPSIVATGKNTTILHYTQRNHQLKNGDLVVVDIGAEYGQYAADLTRTYPVGGMFSPRQKEVYQLVLEAQAYIESIAMPGMYLKNGQYPEKSLHHKTVQFFESRGYAKYFCHGIGHYLGLDVHDVGSYNVPLEPGMIFTIEPGLYIAEENIGVRIEDDYIMADDGAVCLSYDLPKDCDAVEQMMRAE